MLISAYSQGIFPMAHEDADWDVFWYAPDPRTIIEFDEFHVPKRLGRTVRQGKFEVRFSTAFEQVMRECAQPRPHDGIWISEGLIEAYCELHELGFAHSVECWQDDELVGGLYGVALRGLFAGESMFHKVTDASKVALVHLVEHLQEKGFVLLDTQFTTAHLAKFGAKEIPRAEYERRVSMAMNVDAHFI
jgi:leucyl/phenylalanyl-tRNA--protein transferase